MPDRSRYPQGFNPHSFYHPQPYTVPRQHLDEIQELSRETGYGDILISLEEVRESHPTATHIFFEHDGGDSRDVTAVIEHRTETINPNFAAETKKYQEGMAAWHRAKAEWEALSKRWKDEVDAEKQSADYQVYLKLKAQFGG